MSVRLYANVVTLVVVSEQPIPPATPLTELAYRCCTNCWPVQSLDIRPRQMTAKESAALPAELLPQSEVSPFPIEPGR